MGHINHDMEGRPGSFDAHPRIMELQSFTPLFSSLPPLMPHISECVPQLPLTPPSTDEGPQEEEVLASAVHVLSTEATALSCLARLYETNPVARSGFASAVAAISRSIYRGGKLIVSGIGKSGKVGEKLVTTMNSLGILTVFLHPTEALHGDLGIIRQVRFFYHI